MMDKEQRPGDHPDDAVPNGTAPEKSTAYTGQPDDLHDLFGSAGADEEDPLAALRNDPNYAALIRDLEYIAAQAKDLFTAVEEEPSDKVWKEIAIKLAEEPKPTDAEEAF